MMPERGLVSEAIARYRKGLRATASGGHADQAGGSLLDLDLGGGDAR
jgi:hypothetical protein